MSWTIERGKQAEMLQKNDTFRDVIEAIRASKAEVFLNPDSSQEDRESAHEIIRALAEIDGELNTRILDAAFEEEKEPAP